MYATLTLYCSIRSMFRVLGIYNFESNLKLKYWMEWFLIYICLHLALACKSLYFKITIVVVVCVDQQDRYLYIFTAPFQARFERWFIKAERRWRRGSRDKGTTGHPVPICPGTVPGRPFPLETLRRGGRDGYLQ